MSEIPIKTILPERIAPGDAIGIIAPASPFDKTQLLKGISIIEQLGFQCVFSKDIFKSVGYLAGSDFHRAELFHSVFADNSIKAVWCARGGYGSLRILSLIDYNVIRSHPKIFIGSSDVSALLNTIHSRCNIVTYHGPMIASLSDASDITIQSLSDVLFASQVLSIHPKNPLVIKTGKASGIVSGGNLTTLCHLVGTPYQPDFSKHLLLLEDTGEAPYRIDRMLTQMKVAGLFSNIAGIILGSFLNCGNMHDVISIFDDIFSDTNVPILAGFDVGHGEPNLMIPIGVAANLDTDSLTLSYNRLHFKK